TTISSATTAPSQRRTAPERKAAGRSRAEVRGPIHARGRVVCGITEMLSRPADLGARLAGVLVDDDEVEEELTAHVPLADGVARDALGFGPIGDVSVEQRLGILGRPVLAVVVAREGQRGAARMRGRSGECP